MMMVSVRDPCPHLWWISLLHYMVPGMWWTLCLTQHLGTISPITYSPTHPLHSIHHHGDGTRQESVIWGMYSFTLFTAPAISGLCMNATVPALWVCFLFQSEHAAHANERLSTLVLSPDWQKDVHSNRSGRDRQLLFQFAFKGEINRLNFTYK